MSFGNAVLTALRFVEDATYPRAYFQAMLGIREIEL
jgi:hypothetical protein